MVWEKSHFITEIFTSQCQNVALFFSQTLLFKNENFDEYSELLTISKGIIVFGKYIFLFHLENLYFWSIDQKVLSSYNKTLL